MNQPEDRRDQWRVEADQRWLAAHSSDNFDRLRRRFRRLAGIANGISNAELGPFGGVPRNPNLKVNRKSYAVIRYTEHRIAYTTIHIDLRRCPRCRRRLALMLQRIVLVRESGGRVAVGTVRMCRYCQADSWMFQSHMPTTIRARGRSRKVVL